MRMCAFDVVANNADRKSGHVLLAEDRLWAIDNGLCFNEQDKLRTVIWDFGGEPLPPEDIGGAGALRAGRPVGPDVRAPHGAARWPRSVPERRRSCASGRSPSWSTTGGGPPIRGPSSERRRPTLTAGSKWSGPRR